MRLDCDTANIFARMQQGAKLLDADDDGELFTGLFQIISRQPQITRYLDYESPHTRSAERKRRGCTHNPPQTAANRNGPSSVIGSATHNLAHPLSITASR